MEVVKDMGILVMEVVRNTGISVMEVVMYMGISVIEVVRDMGISVMEVVRDMGISVMEVVRDMGVSVMEVVRDKETKKQECHHSTVNLSQARRPKSRDAIILLYTFHRQRNQQTGLCHLFTLRKYWRAQSLSL